MTLEYAPVNTLDLKVTRDYLHQAGGSALKWEIITTDNPSLIHIKFRIDGKALGGIEVFLMKVLRKPGFFVHKVAWCARIVNNEKLLDYGAVVGKGQVETLDAVFRSLAGKQPSLQTEQIATAIEAL